ncbi:hypothetical protein SAMN05216268_15011, partial [Streptomyces yunnanensis]
MQRAGSQATAEAGKVTALGDSVMIAPAPAPAPAPA